MDAIKETIKSATGNSADSKGHYEPGHQAPVSSQSFPGLQHDMPLEAINDQLPTSDGGYQPYLAAGKLRGKKALITGGDSGIGRAVAILYALEGADSVLVYLPHEEDDARETQRLVREKAPAASVHLIAADLRAAATCRDVVEQARQRLGGALNILVLNHGFQMMRESIAELDEQQWVKTFDTNIHPFFYLAKAALPHMRRGDTIITCSSVNPYVGRPDLLDYTSTKGAIVAFTRALSNQQLERGIRVNSVAPGPIWTPLIPATMNKKAQEGFTSPMGRPGQPAEVATCFVFLASADSSFISGQTLHPNGGTIVGS